MLLFICMTLIAPSLLVADGASNNPELIFTHVLFRHGDRSPSGTFPTDPYQESIWPQGWSQLTSLGMQQQYGLGSWLRKTYDGFLTENYTRTDFYARATEKDRTIQSALSNLAALFPPIANQIWSTSNPVAQLWQPIPVQTYPSHLDDLLAVNGIPCPTYDKVYGEQSMSVIEEYDKTYASFFRFLQNVTGFESVSFSSIGNVYDPLNCELAHQLNVSSWVYETYNSTTNETVWDLIREIKRVNKNLYYNSPQKSRLTSGYLLGDILTRMQNATIGKQNNANKFIMYSSSIQHDDTVMSLMYAMNVANDLLVPYATCVIFDLYKGANSTFFVNVRYKNETNNEPYNLTVPGCESYDCPLETMQVVLQGQVLYPQKKREEACGLPTTCPSGNSASKFSSLSGLLFLAIFIRRLV